MIADEPVEKLIWDRAKVAELCASAVNSGMCALKIDSIEKVIMELTDLKMVYSVYFK